MLFKFVRENWLKENITFYLYVFWNYRFLCIAYYGYKRIHCRELVIILVKFIE